MNQGNKTAFNASPLNSLNQQLDLERDVQKKLGQGSDFQEGIRAFIEKREPDFKGK